MTPELKCTELNGAKCIKFLIEPVKHMCTTHRLKANGQGLTLRLVWSFQAPCLTINHTWLRRTLVLCHFLVGAAMVWRWICLFLPWSPWRWILNLNCFLRAWALIFAFCALEENTLSRLFVSQKYDTRVISSVMELFFPMSATLTPVSRSKLVTGTTRKEVPPKAAISLKESNALFLHLKRQNNSLHPLIFSTLLSSLLLLKLFPRKRHILANLVNQEHSINLVPHQW